MLLLFVTTMLTAFSIVREKERGTLEQLFVTPVRPLGLMMGKIMPYFGLAIVELLMILAFMRYAFGVPIHGSILLLVGLSMCYMFTHLSLGMLISVEGQFAERRHATLDGNHVAEYFPFGLHLPA